MPASTSKTKTALIESHCGRCHFVDRPSEMYAEATHITEVTGGHYLDQFTNAERATDWRGNDNIAESIYEQMREEPHPIPTWNRGGRRDGWHQCHHRALYPLPTSRHPVVRRRSGELRVLPVLRRRQE